MQSETDRPDPNFRKKVELLRGSHLFNGVPEDELEQIARLFTTVTLEAEERLFSQGDPGNSFYFILEGEVHITQFRQGEEVLLSTITEGDFFGEGSLLSGEPRRASVMAGGVTVLLRLAREHFRELVRTYPEIGRELVAVSQGYDIARKRQFKWLMEDEGLHLVARKHPAVLWFAMVPVVLIAIAGVAALAYAFSQQIVLLEFLGGGALTFALGWGAWKWIDWGNDYYVVTDKRVVWLEVVLLMYESLQEASLTEVRSVDISTTIIQRILGYGDIIVRTFTTNIVMRNIAQPERYKILIQEYWHRAQQQSKKDETDTMDRRLRERIGLPVEKQKKKRAITMPDMLRAPETNAPGTWERIFANFFKVRFEEEGVVTYRKHWFVLFLTIWQSTLAMVLILTLGSYLGYRYPSTGLIVFFIVLFLIALGWWIYNYWDWRDDRYQLTDSNIVDLERKPLGREVSKSAPLEKIISMEHEREGIIGILLNFGTVSINVGDTTFDFLGVHNPSSVRQEISDRQQIRLKHNQEDKDRREQERWLQWFARYHRNASELWRPDEAPEIEEDEEEII